MNDYKREILRAKLSKIEGLCNCSFCKRVLHPANNLFKKAAAKRTRRMFKNEIKKGW